MQANIMAQGLELMIYGMGTVVVFLALLVVATASMSALVGRYFAEAPTRNTAGVPVSPDLPRNDVPLDDAELVAVISAALHQHRNRQ